MKPEISRGVARLVSERIQFGPAPLARQVRQDPCGDLDGAQPVGQNEEALVTDRLRLGQKVRRGRRGWTGEQCVRRGAELGDRDAVPVITYRAARPRRAPARRRSLRLVLCVELI